MTTAHRPTWKAAVGRAAEGGFGGPSSAQSILDVAAHTKLKVRKGHQLIVDPKQADPKSKKAELLRASLQKLQEAEAKLKLSKSNENSNQWIEKREIIPAIEAEGRRRLLKQTADVDDVKLKEKYNDADEDNDNDDEDADDDTLGFSDENSDLGEESDLDASDSDLDDDDDSDDEDEEAALQAELAKIRAERAASKAKQEAEAAREDEARLEEAALMGNPLLATDGTNGTTGKLKRRWNDDVVFRNQAKGEPDRNKKRFINDTVRNDFHKRFLNKFIL